MIKLFQQLLTGERISTLCPTEYYMYWVDVGHLECGFGDIQVKCLECIVVLTDPLHVLESRLLTGITGARNDHMCYYWMCLLVHYINSI